MATSQQLPLISCTQKIAIYETQARYYVVGSSHTETRFRVLKIDRTEPKDLHIVDDKVEYTRKEIRNLLMMISVGNLPKHGVKAGATSGLTRTALAFGIVGFIRFLEGYYMILITKRRRVAVVGHHTIYKIEDTQMLYIPNDTEVGKTVHHPDEARYMKIFQNVDLSSNFYFSYSYDLTHTLQYNMTACKGVQSGLSPQSSEQILFWQTHEQEPYIFTTPHDDNDVEDASQAVQNFMEDGNSGGGRTPTESERDGKSERPGEKEEGFVYGVRSEPSWDYVWNQHMLKNADHLHSDWTLYVIHGFVGQSNMLVFGRPLYLTLVARRSNRFAGTRFLKRGANEEGYVANEIETEQIIQDSSLSLMHKARLASFVQLRGSLPLRWSQDTSKMVPKPQIILDQSDPYGFIAGQHFNRVLRRYGAPIVILNLVKKREKKRHERVLTEEVVQVVQYLNQFLPPHHSIKYIGFDMARVSKNKKANVLMRLAEIAEYCVKKTGFFQTGPELYCNQLRPNVRCKGLSNLRQDQYRIQQGVVRTNCVDCLDRTNTAQFALGKCAMAFQLYALGIIDSPSLDFDTDCVRMLEDLYEDHGDTLALQYGGSQLVHRIKSYRNVAPWTSSSRDIMQTLSRYYSNTFSDAEKQQALNLFLGVFEPSPGQQNLWEITSDFYLHNPVTFHGPKPKERSYSQWWERPVMRCLPLAYEEETKGLNKSARVIKTHYRDERIDGFWEQYKPFELTSFDELYSLRMPNSVKDFMPKYSQSDSPFALRVHPGRRQEESGASASETNPNLSGHASTSSTTSTGSEGSTSSSEGSDIDGDIDFMDEYEMHKEDSGLSLVSLKDLFPTMAQTYGVDIQQPTKKNILSYQRYVQIGINASRPVEGKPEDKDARTVTNLVQKSIFPLDSSYNVEPPTVTAPSRDIYQTYVNRGLYGAEKPSKRSLKVYQQYFSNKFL